MRHQDQCIISDHQFSNELGQTQTPCLVTKVVEEVTKKVAKVTKVVEEVTKEVENCNS